MPLPGQAKEKAVPTETPNLKKHDEEYQTPVVDTRKEAYDTLTAFPAGQRWDTDFYTQVQGRDSAAASFQEDLPPALGQLELIKGMELVVTQPLSHSQSSDDNRGWETTGSSTFYNVRTPNKGDVFIADIGNGMNALFQVTDSKRNTIYPEAGTEISYRATRALNPKTMKALKEKTVKTWIFDRENMRNGVRALLSEEEVGVIRRLGRAYDRLAHLYLRDFYDTDIKTLLVPGQYKKGEYKPTYDPYMTRFIRATLDTRAFPKVLQITELGVAHDEMSNQLSVFDAVLRMDFSLLYSVSKFAGVSPIHSFRARPLMNSIFFSGVKQVVTMRDIPYSVDTWDKYPHAYKDLVKADTRQTGIDEILPILDLTDNDKILGHDIPLIHRVVVDPFYIFSEAFYENKPGKSVLETLLYNRLDSETTDLEKLAEVAENAVRWDNLERYYYVPFVLALIKLAPGVL